MTFSRLLSRRIDRTLSRRIDDRGFGGNVSGAALLLADEPDGLAIDFTDTFYVGGTGYYGSAYIVDTPGAATLLGTEQYGLAIDFTDTFYVGGTGYYGSAKVLV